MLLYLLRHAEPDASSSYRDDDRPLTAHGKLQASAVAAFLKRSKSIPEAILCSPYLRAVQTAEALVAAFPGCTLTEAEPLVQNTKDALLFRTINEHPAESILLVGHEPQLVRVASTLLTRTKDLELELKKCSLICLETAKPVPNGLAILKWLITFEQMNLATSA